MKFLYLILHFTLLFGYRVEYDGYTTLNLDDKGNLEIPGTMTSYFISTDRSSIIASQVKTDTPDEDTNITIDINISKKLPDDITINCKTFSLSAEDGIDYTKLDKNITIKSGDTGATLDIEIKSDGNTGQNRGFIIQLEAVENKKMIKEKSNIYILIRKKDTSGSDDSDNGNSSWF